MAYRASAVEPKTAWARHLDGVMRDRDWSRVRLFEEVGADLGYKPKSRSAFLRLLDDTDPTDMQATVLERHFGTPPPLESPRPAIALDPYEVIDRLSTTLGELTDELRAAREERASMADRVETLESLVDGLVSQALAADPARSAPRETTGSVAAEPQAGLTFYGHAPRYRASHHVSNFGSPEVPPMFRAPPEVW